MGDEALESIAMESLGVQELAAQAKAQCPVSKALAAVPEILLSAALVG